MVCVTYTLDMSFMVTSTTSVFFISLGTVLFSSPAACQVNVLVGADFNTRLADFGLTIVGETSAVGMTTTHSGSGTLRWKPPERLREDDRRTFAGDIWAFAWLCIVVSSSARILPFCFFEADFAIYSYIPESVLTLLCLTLPSSRMSLMGAHHRVRRCNNATDTPFQTHYGVYSSDVGIQSPWSDPPYTSLLTFWKSFRRVVFRTLEPCSLAVFNLNIYSTLYSVYAPCTSVVSFDWTY
jgi:serine/threonine protein kinase